LPEIKPALQAWGHRRPNAHELAPRHSLETNRVRLNVFDAILSVLKARTPDLVTRRVEQHKLGLPGLGFGAGLGTRRRMKSKLGSTPAPKAPLKRARSR
jgi:hypothetical protein